MLETVLSFASALVEGLSKIKIRKSEKRTVGQALCKLYIGLCEVVDNGRNIVKLLEKRGTQIDYLALHKLLIEQSIRLKKIQLTVKSSKISKILNVYLPKITDLKILVEGKGERVAVLLEKIEKHKFGNYREVALDFPLPYYIHGRFVKPSKISLGKAKEILDKLESIAENLREFIVGNFEANEII